MRIVCMTNEGQLSMMKNMLNSAVKTGWDLSQFHCYIMKTQQEAATYMTKNFQNITIRKLEIILENMQKDSEIIWIDNDIVLFQNCIADMKKNSGHFVGQDDNWGVICTGFFLARTNFTSISVIKKSINWLKQQDSSKNDQHAFAAIAPLTPALFVDKLDQDEYPNGNIYFTQERKSKAKMVHNNYLLTTAEKITRFKQNNLWDDSDTGYNLANKYFI